MFSSKGNLPVRDTDTGNLLELLIVMAVVTILINRAFLAMTNYPKIAFGSLHISHMLWGGLLMLFALVMLFRFWNPSIRLLAAFISGVGFGLFIDELGKFITEDNDYFFQPTIAILYILFVTLFLIFRSLINRFPLTEREISVNRSFREILGSSIIPESRYLRSYYFVRRIAFTTLNRFLSIPKVIPAVMLLFVFASLLQFATIFGWVNPNWVPFDNVSGLSIVGAFISSMFVLIGLLRFRSSRITAAHWFKRAILINIFVTQIFLFYQSQLTAMWGLAVTLLVYACISYYISYHPDTKAECSGVTYTYQNL
ncbi:MAG: hypothetical protein KAW14_06225 [Candidatus Aegiribacteria sp.]|nr:hypothetical protein [Candidatus Aegiribacteria sp.]